MPLNYSIVQQTTDQLKETENSPSVSMWPYLVNSAQTQLINQISIYAEAGDTADRARVLYMNETALQIWKKMDRAAGSVGEVHRPPKSALLLFGMPFSE
ncbi:MAG TPA: hypothetical protein VK593_00465 [Edaphobacter sp.]|nr:hypothetical protein [Edaphobacter sp.]